MIITRLKGGLGNQLFQYATTRNLALLYNTDFYFDPSYFYKTKNGDVYLNKFPFAKVPLWTGKCSLLKCNDEFLYKLIPNNSYLKGWWQSEKYFIEHENIIQNELSFSPETKSYVLNNYPFLQQNTISMHIRRGDYINKPNEYPFPGLDFYHRAYEYINDKTANIVVLSDDISWCKENIKFPNVKFIEGESDIVDLCIMANCSNNIICNSTFSWWGAWLNKSQKKNIIAPKVWFGSAIKLNDSDIIPQQWIKL